LTAAALYSAQSCVAFCIPSPAAAALQLVVQVLDLASQEKGVVGAQEIGSAWKTPWSDPPSHDEEGQQEYDEFAALQRPGQIGESDMEPRLDAVHGSMTNKVSPHPTGMEGLPPAWLDSALAQSVDPVPADRPAFDRTGNADRT